MRRFVRSPVDIGSDHELFANGGPFAALVQPTLQHESDVIP